MAHQITLTDEDYEEAAMGRRAQKVGVSRPWALELVTKDCGSR